MDRLAAAALPLLRLLPAETAHRLAIRALAAGAAPRTAAVDDPILATRVWNLAFGNPLGLAAGFDKNAEVPDAMLRWGLGFAEIGTVTPLPQTGNPRPRLFRLTADRAIINRMGFNNDGLAAVAQRLAGRKRCGILGANLGKNRDATNIVAEYSAGVDALGPLADYLVINVSSPNTPGLRDLQKRQAAAELIDAVLAARSRLDRQPPLLLKIAPDLDRRETEDIAMLALTTGLDGLIVSNTTIERPETLLGRQARETGGLSGQPLFERSTRLLLTLYRLTEGRVRLVGAGGIASGADAYAKIRAGASLVQLYTALVYAGPQLVPRIKAELAAALRADGFASVSDAVGADA